ncbi:collagen alpha-1(I) chain-like [Lutra lutra]|uniref:collagen alpha-1(I) chain-like n=1 Tax=Lutra lutra TaxID=9657 RepID=UPI001FD1A1E5|nr:collagen alpha-1(I) chain-like [Lutra lutra]
MPAQGPQAAPRSRVSTRAPGRPDTGSTGRPGSSGGPRTPGGRRPSTDPGTGGVLVDPVHRAGRRDARACARRDRAPAAPPASHPPLGKGSAGPDPRRRPRAPSSRAHRLPPPSPSQPGAQGPSEAGEGPVYRPSQTPHLALSPERVAPGRRGRALGARSESPSGLAPPPHRAPAEARRRAEPRPGGGPGGGDRRADRRGGEGGEGGGRRGTEPPPPAARPPTRAAGRAGARWAPRVRPRRPPQLGRSTGRARLASRVAAAAGPPGARAPGQRELTGRRRNRDAFQGTGPSLGANPFQGALPFTKKRELSPGLPPASPGSVALPHWTPRGAHLRHSGFGDLNPTPFRSAEGNGGHRPSLRNGARPSLRTD